MSFPRYPSYKDSGVEWLGEVPGHWEVSAIKRYADKITDGAHVSPETENGVFHFVSTKDVGADSIDFENCLRTSEQSFDYLVKTGCRPLMGDVLFSKDGTIGRTVVVREDRDFVVASSLIIIRPTVKILDSNFLNCLCQSQSIANQVECFVKGAGLPRLSIQNLTKVVGCFPPLPEQTQIAAFLNRETAKIDELVAEQRRLMELLKEKRQAVISHAVTQGLNPRAPMRPSGIEWLGDVPEHWDIIPLSKMADWDGGLFLDGDWIESVDISEDGIRYLTSGNVGEGEYKEQGQGFITQAKFDELKCTEVVPGDILISRLNLPAGRACLVPELGGKIVTCVDNVIFRPRQSYDRRYLVYVFSTNQHFANTEILARGATMQRISRSSLGGIRFALPPSEEQVAILRYLSDELGAIDGLTAEGQRAIDLLQERRTTLISAAVTGQIDVRGFATTGTA